MNAKEDAHALIYVGGLLLEYCRQCDWMSRPSSDCSPKEPRMHLQEHQGEVAQRRNLCFCQVSVPSRGKVPPDRECVSSTEKSCLEDTERCALSPHRQSPCWQRWTYESTIENYAVLQVPRTIDVYQHCWKSKVLVKLGCNNTKVLSTHKGGKQA